MKLITHNVLSSKGIKDVKSGYPLKIEVRMIALLIAQKPKIVVQPKYRFLKPV